MDVQDGSSVVRREGINTWSPAGRSGGSASGRERRPAQGDGAGMRFLAALGGWSPRS